MIFVDTNVFVYAVGRPHPLRDPARRILLDAADDSEALVTSCEVLQEFLHVYLPVERLEALVERYALRSLPSARLRWTDRKFEVQRRGWTRTGLRLRRPRYGGL